MKSLCALSCYRIISQILRNLYPSRGLGSFQVNPTHEPNHQALRPTLQCSECAAVNIVSSSFFYWRLFSVGCSLFSPSFLSPSLLLTLGKGINDVANDAFGPEFPGQEIGLSLPAYRNLFNLVDRLVKKGAVRHDPGWQRWSFLPSSPKHHYK